MDLQGKPRGILWMFLLEVMPARPGSESGYTGKDLELLSGLKSGLKSQGVLGFRRQQD